MSFPGKRVVVIGAGQSALESAALLQETGAEVEVVAKISQMRWIGMHSWLHHLGPISMMLYSKYDVGPAGIKPDGGFTQTNVVCSASCQRQNEGQGSSPRRVKMASSAIDESEADNRA